MQGDNIVPGLIAGICIPILFFFLVKGIGWLLASYVFDSFNGFSLKLNCILAIVANLIPFQIFNRQGRYRAMQGVVGMTFILIAAVLIYFRGSFF